MVVPHRSSCINLVSCLFFKVVNDIWCLLCCQVTPALCRHSWSWKKHCVSTNSTKTQNSLSTVSLLTQAELLTYHAQFQDLTHRMSSCPVTSQMLLHTRSLVQMRSLLSFDSLLLDQFADVFVELLIISQAGSVTVFSITAH